MKRIFFSLILFTSALFMSACNSEEHADSEYILNLGVTQNSDNAEFKGLEQFKERVEERTNGDISIELYHSDQLSSVPDLLEQSAMGANVGTISDAAMLGDLKKEFSILQSPYIFDGYEEIEKFVSSDTYEGWVDEFSDRGLRILSFNFELGERNLATTRRVSSPEELQGNVIRTSGALIANKTVESMGGAPTGMPWSEAYSGLEQGVIDGVEAHNLAIYESSMYEVIDYIAKTNHYQLLSAFIISEEWFNELPEDYQQILIEEAEAAGNTASDIAKNVSVEYEQAMAEEGVEFIEVDREAFRERTERIYGELDMEDIRNDVLEVLNND